MPEVAPSALAPFRNPRYRAYWLTGLAANFGWLIQGVGAAWLMALIGGSPSMVGLVQTSIAVPMMLFALPAGAVADALGKRTIILWSQVLLFVFSATLAAAAYFGLLAPWSLLLFTFLVGSGKALNNPGWQTMASELVTREELPQAIALNSVGFNLARTMGPAVGGVLVATVGAFAAFLVNALANLWVVFVARKWPAGERRTGLPPEPVGGAILAGLRYVALSPNMLVVMARGAIFNFAGISVMALMPLVARDLIGGDSRTYGLLLGAFGLGAVVGAFVSNRLARRLSPEWRVRLGFALFALATFGLGESRTLLLSIPAAMLAGGCWLMTLSTLNTTVQMSAPRWVVSRCLALYQTAIFGGSAAGGLLWGLIADHGSLTLSMTGSAAVMALGAAAGLVLSLRDFDAASVDIHAPWTAPESRLDILPKSGPMLCEIEYRVPAANEAAFLAAMAQRRRARLKRGARRWTLSRDLTDPEHWTERFKTATWIDMQRMHLRRSVSEAQLSQQLRELTDPSLPMKLRYQLVRDPAAEARPEDGLVRAVDP
ncbi:MAG: MFS transporter [Rhodobacteraceae bacterium]|nr:MFS transporter [Paracoccaceae bacterium]